MKALSEQLANLDTRQRALLLQRWQEKAGGKEADADVDGVQPVARGKELPLSFAQQRMWFLQQLDPESTAYNMPCRVRISGPLQVEVLERSIQEIIRRHEILRTTFELKQGQPVQIVHPAASMKLDIINLEAFPAEEQDRRVEQLLIGEVRRHLDLSRGPLIWLSLARLEPQVHVLFLNLHHIIADGWSLGVFAKEFVHLYEAFSLGKPSPLPELLVQYADFAVWQRQWLQGKVLQKQLHYWKERLKNAPKLLELPTDRQRPIAQTHEGRREWMVVCEDLSEELKVLAHRRGVTLFVLLSAAFKLLMYRFSGQEDIMVGTPIAARNRPEIEGLIGFFVNTLVLRTDLSGDPTFEELLERERVVTLGAFEHQDLPFERLVEELQPERDLSRNSLFQVWFVLQGPMEPLKVNGLEFAIGLEQRTSKFDLMLTLENSRAGMQFALEYNTDLFEAATIRRLASHWQELLRTVVSYPSKRLSELSMPSRAEHEQIMKWNGTGRDYSPVRCVHTLFEEQVERTPQAVAVVCEEQSLTYRELNARANQLAGYLRELGVGPESAVGICVERSVEMVVGLLGILKAGGAYVPLDPSYPKDRLTFMLQDAQVKWILTQRRLAESLGGSPATTLCLDSEWTKVAGQSVANPSAVSCPSNLAYVIYTSGSSGKPKGAMNTHQGLYNRLVWMQEEYGLEAQDSVLQKTPFSFDVSVWEFFWPLMYGARLVMARPGGHQEPDYLIEVICRQKVTTLHFVPSMLQAFLAHPGVERCVELKRVICSGEALPKALVDRFYARLGSELHNLYGPTEASIDVTYWACERESSFQSIPIGRPIANTQIYLSDKWQVLVSVGVVGELHIGGEGLGRGYWNRTDLTAERFIPDSFSQQTGARLYRTGDRARYLMDGSIEYLGRLDHQVKVRGFRIELAEIEETLAKHAWLRENVVVVREDVPGEKMLAAYVIPSPEAVTQTSEVKAERVAEWESVFEDNYSRGVDEGDPTFNIAGWNSSYTGQPIPREQMRDWLDDTLGCIHLCHPKRVLEIGCGTGMILFGLMGRCLEYWGTDFSRKALEHIECQLGRMNGERRRVKLLRQAADDFRGLEKEKFDTIILNSVTQYFPDVEYLLRVLDGAVGLLEEGTIFVGDIRSHALLEAFHASIQWEKAGDDLLLRELQQKVRARIAEENELTIDPRLFLALPGRLPRIRHVEIRPKVVKTDNELSRFRYQVILHIGPAVKTVVVDRWMDGRKEKTTLRELRRLLQNEQPECIGVKGLANRRIWKEVQIIKRMEQSGQNERVGDVKEELRNCPPEGMEPGELYALGNELGYRVEISWARQWMDGRYDVAFWKPKNSVIGERTHIAFGLAEERPMRFEENVNNPLSGRIARHIVPQLRDFLQARLPEYMVPKVFTVLESMPLLPNGKIDRKGLPAPYLSRQGLAQKFVAARTEVEEELASIWAEVLRLESVGIHDNFFELGGDSISSIQVIARAVEAGLPLTARDLFQHQTVAGLAAVAERASLGGRGAVNGPVELTPMQRWFFETCSEVPHRATRSRWFQVSDALSPDLVEKVAQWLVEHHDALGMRFEQIDGQWRQNSTPEIANVFERVDLSGVPEAEYRAALMAAMARVQANFNLKERPLIRIVWSEGGQARSPRLWVVIHRLVADERSWRILLEDLELGCRQLMVGEPLQLSPKPGSFRQWMVQLKGYAQSDQLRHELQYWLDAVAGPFSALPVDFPGGENGEVSQKVFSVGLSEAETRVLLTEILKRYHARLYEVVLSALQQALTDWAAASVRVDLDGQGRQVETVRTVGWLSPIFPIVLSRTDDEPSVALRQVKETLRGIPESGMGHGVLKYLTEGCAEAAELRLRRSDILFTYTEPIDPASESESLFSVAPESGGPVENECSRTGYLLRITSSVLDQKLEVHWNYNEKLHRRETIQKVAESFQAILRRMISRFRSGAVADLNPSDFPLVNLDQEELNTLTQTHGSLEDIYTVSPMQAGFLFHTLYQPDSGMYLQQMTYELHGQLNIPAVKRAWEQLVARHSVLRTSFVLEGLREPVQLVHGRVSPEWTEEDWRDYCREEQQRRLMQFLSADRKRGFVLHEAPLMRFALLRTGPDVYEFVWSHHHALLDGWSVSLLLNELLKAYNGLCEGREGASVAARPYRDYIKWLKTQDATAAERYWRRTLKGFAEPLLIAGESSRREVGEIRRSSGKFPAELTRALRAFCRQNGLTINTLIQGAWALLLAQCSGRDDVVFGATTSGRPAGLEGIESMVGVFMNTPPVRAKINWNAKVSEWLKELQHDQLEARQFEYASLVQIQAWSELSRGLPLFDTICVFQNFPVDSALRKEDAWGFRIDSTQVESRLNYPLTITVTVAGEEIDLQVSYDVASVGIADGETINVHMLQLLAWLIQHQEARLAEFNRFDGKRAAIWPAAKTTEENVIAITATFTAEPLRDALRFWMKELGMPGKIKFSPYNQLFQQLLDPEGLLAGNTSGVNVILINIEDFERDRNLTLDEVRREACNFVAALKKSAGRSVSPHIVGICPVSPESRLGEMGREIEDLLSVEFEGHKTVSLIKSDEWQRFYPVKEYYDPQGYELGHVSYTPEFFTAIGTMLARKIFSLFNPPYKVIVVDCDYTLWTGSCTEDGASGITIEPPRRALQRFLLGQKEMGKLLCLCSRNDESDVAQVFQTRSDMCIGYADVVACRINWKPKSENLKSLAEELGVGLDSFVFIDDNPMECADVQVNCPQVLTLQLPRCAEDIEEYLKHLWVFDQAGITETDKRRTQHYQENREREQFRRESPSLEAFLASLNLSVDIGEAKLEHLPRVAQLTQRTNQFNTTGIRRNTVELEHLLESGERECLVVQVQDRFGDYGLTGVVLFNEDAQAIRVDAFLLSCRVFGKGIEHKMLARLGVIASERRLAYVDVLYRATEKNQFARNFLEGAGGQEYQAGVFRLAAEALRNFVYAPNQDAKDIPVASSHIHQMTTRRADSGTWRRIALELSRIEQIRKAIEGTKRNVGARRSPEYIAPRTSTEMGLAEIWSVLFGLESISTSDHFFDLGGDSLLAIQLVSRVRKRFGVALPLPSVFDSPRLGLQAEIIEWGLQKGGSPVNLHGERESGTL